MSRGQAVRTIIAAGAATCLLACCGRAVLAQNDAAGRKLAFLAGVKEYDHSDLKNLDFPENDIEELAALLNTQGFQTVVLTTSRGQKNEQDKPKVDTIRRRLELALQGLTKRDLLIVGLAGHGLQLVGKKESYFCPCDANPSVAAGKLTRPESLISLDEILRHFRTSGAGCKFLLVDACRNDPEIRGVADLEAVVPAQTGILLSCRPGEFAFEDKSLGSGHGVFFYHVIEGLKGLAQEKGSSEVTWDGLAHYVQTEVPRTVHALFGKDGGDQNPNLMANIAGVPPALARVALVAPPPGGAPLAARKANTLGAVREFAGPIKTGRQALRAVAAMLPKYHLSHRQLDDDVSRHWLENFLQRLDPGKAYFYQANIDRFLSRQDELDDLAREGDTSFAFEIVKIFRQRVDERTRLATEFVAAPHDFTIEEQLVTDPQQVNYAASLADAREMWRKKVKLDLLTEKSRGVGSDEAQAKLVRRYHRIRRQAYQYDENDVVELYLTALARAYDPHSRYIPAEGVEAYVAETTLQSEGVGFRFQTVDDDFVIAEIFPGGPAGKDGRLRPGDRLVGVGQGESGSIMQIDGMKLSAVDRLLRGEKGTVVRLQIVPVGKSARVIYNVARGEFQLDEARGTVIDRGRKADGTPLRVGYISIPRFYAAAGKGQKANGKSVSGDVRRLLADPERGFQAAGVDAVVLDLRTTGGGLHVQGTKLAGLFIGSGPVGQVRDAEGRLFRDASDTPAVWNGPLVVLTSHQTGGTAQYFAAVLQDYGRALIVGDSGTLGDGTSHSTFDVGLYAARNIAPVGDGPPDSAVQTDAPRLGSLRVTVRQSFRLNGDSLQLRGVRADVILPSLTDHMKVGEAFLPQAVRFDRVEPIHHASFAMVTDDQKSRLQAFSDQRRRNSADFQRLADEIARLEARNGRKAISLQEAKAREELKPIGTFPGRKSNGQLFGPTFYNNEVLAVTTDYLRLQGRSTLQPAATAVPRRIHASWGWTNDPTAPAQTASDLTATAPSLRSTPSQTPSGGGTEPALLIAPFDPPQVRTIRDAWAQYQKTDVEWRNSLGMDLTLIPAGQFAMGSPDAANGEFPLHQVTISRPFYLGKYKVTKGQFKKFVEAIGYVTDTEADGGASWGYTADKRQPFQARPEFNWADWGVDQSDGSPVVNVSWNDAMAFCYWLSQKDGKTYRLPTEAEWEYACRAGTTTRFYNGENAEELTQIANVLDAAAKAQIPAVSEQLASSDGWAFTSPVGQFRPNNFGLYDMTGNAREWCADWYDKDYYATSPERDPAGPPSGFFRVSRGGGWNSPAALCSSARRGYGEPTARDFNLGFRVVQGGADVQTGWTIQNWEYQIHRHRRQIAVRHTEARAGGQQTTRAQQTPGQTGVIRQQAPASGGSSKGQIGRGKRRK